MRAEAQMAWTTFTQRMLIRHLQRRRGMFLNLLTIKYIQIDTFPTRQPPPLHHLRGLETWMRLLPLMYSMFSLNILLMFYLPIGYATYTAATPPFVRSRAHSSHFPRPKLVWISETLPQVLAHYQVKGCRKAKGSTGRWIYQGDGPFSVDLVYLKSLKIVLQICFS
jgi:hypothetical protein